MSGRAIRALAAALLLSACGPAAAGLQVMPVGLQFERATTAQGLWLANTGREALRAQVRVFRWTQADGADVLEPARGLLASPPMLHLPAGGRQLVRVIRDARADDAHGEQAYRILVDELPPTEGADEHGVRYVLRYSIPVFVVDGPPRDPESVAAGLEWSVVRSDDGFALQVRNAGDTRAQVATVILVRADGSEQVLVPGLLGYVLPHRTMRWPARLAAAPAAGDRIRVTVNGRPVDASYPIGRLAR